MSGSTSRNRKGSHYSLSALCYPTLLLVLREELCSHGEFRLLSRPFLFLLLQPPRRVLMGGDHVKTCGRKRRALSTPSLYFCPALSHSLSLRTRYPRGSSRERAVGHRPTMCTFLNRPRVLGVPADPRSSENARCGRWSVKRARKREML